MGDKGNKSHGQYACSVYEMMHGERINKEERKLSCVCNLRDKGVRQLCLSNVSAGELDGDH